MLSGDALLEALKDIRSRPFDNRVFGRAIPFKYNSDLFGRRRPIIPNRFNVLNGARVFYLAEDYITALYEVQQIDGSELSSYILFPVSVHLEAVIDLTDARVQKTLRTNKNELTANFRRIRSPSPTQELGETCSKLGDIDGLIYPSAVDKKRKWVNLAVLEIALSRLNSWIEINDPKNNLLERYPR